MKFAIQTFTHTHRNEEKHMNIQYDSFFLSHHRASCETQVATFCYSMKSYMANTKYIIKVAYIIKQLKNVSKRDFPRTLLCN